MRAFYYENLEAKKRKCYDKLVQGLRGNSAAISMVGLTDKDDLIECIDAVRYDMPEFFYIDFSYISFSYHNDYYEYFPKYIYDETELENRINLINEKTEQIICLVIQNKILTAYDKCLWLHNYLVKNCEYNYDAIRENADVKNAFTIEGFFLEGRAVCLGIALAFKHLCTKLGIESIVVRGNSLKPGNDYYERHAWNIIRIGENAIHVDVTWDMCMSKESSLVRYDYFFLPDIEMMRDHQYVRYPICRNRNISLFCYKNTCFSSCEDIKKYVDSNYSHIDGDNFYFYFKLKNRKEKKADVVAFLLDYISLKARKNITCVYSINETQSVFLFHFSLIL